MRPYLALRSCPIRNTFESVLRSGKPVRGAPAEATVLVAGKQVRLWLEVGADPLTMDGQPHVLLTLADITERRRTEEALQRLAAIITSSEEPIIGKTLDGVIQSWNQGRGGDRIDIAPGGHRRAIRWTRDPGPSR